MAHASDFSLTKEISSTDGSSMECLDTTSIVNGYAANIIYRKRADVSMAKDIHRTHLSLELVTYDTTTVMSSSLPP